MQDAYRLMVGKTEGQTLSFALHLCQPPPHAHQQESPVVKEFRLFALKRMPHKLQDPSKHEEAQRVHP